MPWTFDHPAGAIFVDDARLDDATALVALHREVIAEKDWFITLPSEFQAGVDQKIRQIRDFARSGNSAFLVARRQGRIVGWLTAQGGVLARMRHTAKIEILVGRDARGSGVGHALMSACIAWGTANPHVEKLGLSVFATNERALKLYEAFGFEVEGRREREYKLEDGTYRDDVLMYRWVR
jgi:ribosomal protein S18 acetylase RimI-like enzyme